MKKLIVIMAVLAMALCVLTACDIVEPTPPDTTEEPVVSDTAESTLPDATAFEAYVAAASDDEWHSRHDNVLRIDSRYDDEEIINTLWYYRDSGLAVSKYSDGGATMLSPDYFIQRYSDTQPPEYLCLLYDDPKTTEEYFHYCCADLLNILEREILIETSESEDGVFTAVTQVSGKENVQQEMAAFKALADRVYEDGMTIRYVYTFNVETADLMSADVYLIDADGTSHTVNKTVFSFDVEKYDPAQEGEPFAEYCAAANDPDQTHTVTIVYAADSETEHTVEFVLPHNVHVSALEQGIPVEGLYTDYECMELFEDDTVTDDLTLYAPAVETATE